MEILYCDNHLLVLNKPAGLLTQPNESSDDSLEAFGKRFLKEKFNKPGDVYLEPVHRLDRPVSGVLLFARTSKAISRLHEMQRERIFQKRYYAVAEGRLVDGEFIDYLSHGSHHAFIDPQGKRAHLTYSVLREMEHSTLLEITLKTGLYHQIRAQFSHHGHPILGDRKYGSTHPSEVLYLHHRSMTILHPVSREKLTFIAPLSAPWAPFVE